VVAQVIYDGDARDGHPRVQVRLQENSDWLEGLIHGNAGCSGARRSSASVQAACPPRLLPFRGCTVFGNLALPVTPGELNGYNILHDSNKLWRVERNGN
jgi:hypothetical protein